MNINCYSIQAQFSVTDKITSRQPTEHVAARWGKEYCMHSEYSNNWSSASPLPAQEMELLKLAIQIQTVTKVN